METKKLDKWTSIAVIISGICMVILAVVAIWEVLKKEPTVSLELKQVVKVEKPKLSKK